MPRRTSQSGSELFIVDNSDEDWKVLRYLHDWCQLSKAIDIASGYFEIGSLLALQITARLDASLEAEKNKNDFLTGVPAIVEALRSGKILCRVYRKDKFHAKCYLTHARQEVVGSFALVGSSNFTYPGITENIELNVQISGTPVAVLQEWYEQHWNDAEDVTAEILRTVERHTREYTPFEIYAKALQEFFRGHEMTVTEWERNESKIYPILAGYQREGYHGVMKRAQHYNGAFLCDGVGLGKTFVGLMLIERLVVHDRKNVALFVPYSARTPVWEATLKKYLPHVFGKYSKLEIFNHTDLLRRGTFQEDLDSIRERADVILVDEAHHFRNTGTKGEDEGERQSRYWRMFDICEGKTVIMLTATPVNNRLTDLQHMIELFSRRQTDYFKDAPLGIHSLTGHFRVIEKSLEQALDKQAGSQQLQTNFLEAEQVLGQDALFQALVIQRSRAYVKKSLQQEGSGEILFPQPRDPKVVPYSVKQTYGKLLKSVEDAFSKEEPLFSLPIYYPYAYYQGDDSSIDPLVEGRRKQVVSLIRTGFLKRFESSAEAFGMSCWNLLRKLLAWIEVHAETDGEKALLSRWMNQHKKLTGYVHEHQREMFGDDADSDDDDDIIPDEMLEAVKRLPRDQFRVSDIINETLLDLNQLATFLQLLEDFKPSQDKKLAALLKLLKNDAVLKQHKVLIFTEFKDTARYLKQQLIEAGLDGVEEIDSATKTDRGEVIRRFAPYYNNSSSEELAADGLDEIRVLISTDVLSEGLNLQDCTRLINYDLHWNPVRLMQRIGRVDRRMNPEIERQIVADHPEQEKLRGDVAYWNFLPPDELEQLLDLYRKVSKKTLRISKTFGIEGKKLLKPDDDYDDLRDFHEAYEGTLSPIEHMHLELKQLLVDNPGLENRLSQLPLRVFSGKEHPTPGTRAVFFCYALPARELGDGDATGEAQWSIAAGPTQWYLYDLGSEKTIEEATEIIEFIRCQPDTPRHCILPQPTLAEIRSKVDKHVKNTYLRKVQAPIGIGAILTAWMELN
ncbi:MAG: DEAD/DEAH box helicase family protein [Planctomycetia bacterium]|nr:DEAD/DEAH box helicase family protein [Planctomycetia bacterium]